MSRTKTVARKTMDDPELQNMFNQMVGASDPDPRIVAPKYEDIMSDAKAIVGIFKKTFIESAKIPTELKKDFNVGFQKIQAFVTSAETSLASMTLEKKSMLAGKDTVPINSDPEKLMQYLQGLSHGYNNKELGETYKTLKESNTIDQIVVAARDLRKHLESEKKRHKKEIHDLEDKNKLSEKFVTNCGNDFLELIPSITTLDFHQLFMHELCDYPAKQLIVYAMHLFLHRAMNIVQKIMSPDIDVSAFSEKLVGSIDEIRKVLPRCDKAFNKIKKSVSMLKDNFGGYYKDFVVSKNPGIIVENFVLDVAEDSKADRETTAQFKRIVNFYRKKMQGRVKDPKIQKIFDMVGQNLEVLEQKTGRKYGRNSEDIHDSSNHENDDDTPQTPEKTPEEIAEQKEADHDAWISESNAGSWKKKKSKRK